AEGLRAGGLGQRRAWPLPVLTPALMAGLGIFTRRYFEALWARLPANAILVVDNYQDVASPGWDQLWQDALATLPAGGTTLFLKRAAPPPALVHLAASSELHEIGWEQLRFSPREARSLLLERRDKGGRDAAAGANFDDQVIERCGGW